MSRVVRYEDFKTGLTYQDVYAMLWVDNEDSSTWARKSRGAVLRLWGKLKRDMWAAATGGLTPDEEYVPLERDADGAPLASDDDYAEPDVEELPSEAYETPCVRTPRTIPLSVSPSGFASSIYLGRRHMRRVPLAAMWRVGVRTRP